VWTIGNSNNLYFRHTTGANWTTLPQFFKNKGYRAIGQGKIFHEGNMSGFPCDQDQLFGSWSVPFYHPNDPYNKYNTTNPKPKNNTCPKSCAPLSNGGIDEPWETFNDAKSALTAIEWIKNASKYDDPFFLAVGFHRPHIPYIYPKEFEFKGDVMFPPKDYYITKDVPPVAPHDWTEEGMRYGDLENIRPRITDHNFQQNLSSLCSAVPLVKQAEMKRSYFSCIQYIDHLVGQLIGALQEQGLYDSTTVIFWGDHGYKLGEHCDWFKHDNFEDSTRIPVIIKPAADSVLPTSLGLRGTILEPMVEEVDIYPSLIDLAGFEVPEELQGASWLPLLKNQSGGKEVVFWQYPHHSQANNTEAMGYSLRTEIYHYTEWIRFACNINDPMQSCATKSAAQPHWYG
jgi:iduronate 2-sulfatase